MYPRLIFQKVGSSRDVRGTHKRYDRMHASGMLPSYDGSSTMSKWSNPYDVRSTVGDTGRSEVSDDV